ncbi:hypothetical protein M2157_004932 [Streptomyces sp. SAI-127]|nr:hypothetical protein [Streptomyces sp. SAI-127]
MTFRPSRWAISCWPRWAVAMKRSIASRVWAGVAVGRGSADIGFLIL